MAKSIKSLSGKWGGPRRKPKDFTPETCERFAKKTNELQPLWNFITEFFEKNDYDAGCVTMTKGHSNFARLSSICNGEVPEVLLKRVFKRKNEGGREYWPRTFALLHAKIELGITNPYAVSTLHDRYREGDKLLNATQRSEPKPA